jgi:predicted nucleic-acid-binding protein
MIGIDTNVVVRLLVADDERQADAAASYVKAHCSSEDPGLLSNVVLTECAWVLADVYEYSRTQIAEAIEGLLSTAQLQAANPAGVVTALQRYRGSSADFADCLIGVINAQDGCDYTVTFDRRASKLPEFRSIT